MNTGKLYDNVNFVPTWYTEKCHRRGVAKRMSMLLVTLVAMMGLMVAHTWQKGTDLARYHDTLAAQIRATQFQETEAGKLRYERGRLVEQVRLTRSLAMPIGMTPIVATLAAVTPEEVALTAVDSRIILQKRTKVITPADQTSNGRAVTKTEPYQIVVIEVDGLAPTDVAIANYVGRLASTALFRNVKMQYSRAGEFETVVTREFKLTFEVPLDRNYQRIISPEIADVG